METLGVGTAQMQLDWVVVSRGALCQLVAEMKQISAATQSCPLNAAGNMHKIFNPFAFTHKADKLREEI